MARTREFDTEAAVSRAMELFWRRGYEATSVRDLTHHLGIGQGSLYAAFGDKEGLYRAALEHYRTTLAAAALRSLEEETDVRAAVRTLLTERIRIAVDNGGQGCLAVNAACERLPQDASTGRTVRDMQDASREALTEVLRAAMERGDRGAARPAHGRRVPGDLPQRTAGLFEDHTGRTRPRTSRRPRTDRSRLSNPAASAGRPPAPNL